MKVDVQHSVIQDFSVIKFYKLEDYFKCIKFLSNSDLEWTPLKYSSISNTASIRIDEVVLQKISKRFRITYASTNSNSRSTWMWEDNMDK